MNCPEGMAVAADETTPERKTLLVVDDEDGPRQALHFLFKNDYNVLLAESGPQALELARCQSIDAVILDIRMPGMSGIEVLNHLKKIDPTIEVIILTAYETLETARQALRLGACDYLAKPFDIPTMRQAITTAMERRALSNELKLFHQQLYQLQDEIQKQQLQKEIARTRGDIYASIIHDMNGPLTVISGYVDMINRSIGQSEKLEGDNLDVIKERLARVNAQASNCVQISRRYLSFLRGGAGENAAVSVNQILLDLNSLLKSRPDARRNVLLIEQMPEDLIVQINGTDLIQILLNLTINALQSSAEPHQVRVRGSGLSQSLDLSSFKDGPEDSFINRAGFQNSPPLVALAVSDTGPGIAPESIGKIFESYFTTKPAGQGTGLGLSIVKRLLEQAKGALRLHTQLGRGTEFTLYLPAFEAAPPSGS
jgi:signal transduction histidine kinase